MADSQNHLLASSKTSDSRLSVQLHPLVILTVSDYITRHILRQKAGPIAGAIIGAQNGRDITMEHAFECKLNETKDGEVVVDEAWFHDRLQQYRDVHKNPGLDFVGWFTLSPPSGPQTYHLPIHKQFSTGYNESALLLTFHPESVAESTSKGGKLPLTIYESVYEAGADDGDKQMQEAGEGPQLLLRFKELPYTIETGEAEMIGVDFVARGGANATAAPTAGSEARSKQQNRGNNAEEAVNGDEGDTFYLTTEEEDAIATLTAKGNAILMLRRRIRLMKTYLQSLPPSYLNDASITSCEAQAEVSHTILRSISALLARLPLLSPSTTASGPGSELARDSAAQAVDVALVSLLGKMGSTLEAASQMGKKAAIVEQGRQAARNKQGHNGFPGKFMDMDEEEQEDTYRQMKRAGVEG